MKGKNEFDNDYVKGGITHRQLKDSELLKDAKSDRSAFIIGVDPANGKDQAIYNGKVVK